MYEFIKLAILLILIVFAIGYVVSQLFHKFYMKKIDNYTEEMIAGIKEVVEKAMNKHL